MPQFSRRGFLVGGGASVGLSSAAAGSSVAAFAPQSLPAEPADAELPAEAPRTALASYGPARANPSRSGRHLLSRIHPAYLRTRVAYARDVWPGTIVIDPRARYLYFVERAGTAIRYGVGVGRQGFGWSGDCDDQRQAGMAGLVSAEGDDRAPARAPAQLSELQSGLGVPGGPRNPLGARALYLWQGNKDTLYRIHGTNEPWTSARTSPPAASA